MPEIAARAHVDVLDGIVDRAMKEAGIGFAQLSAVAAAAGPGLIGGVIVGLTTAKAIAMVHDTPLIAVNHLEAHALTPRLTCALAFPYCLFLASGGHTQIVAVVGVGKYVRLGTTVDDAMGEAFDKVAKMLGLPYPGGPEVERAASGGDPKRFAFPRPMLGRADANFSLSGLKTAVRNEASRLTPLEPQDISDLCAGFQAAVLESTADRLSVGLRLFHEQFGPPRALVAAGGVAANQAIRGALQDVAAKAQTTLIIPPPALCTDNGAMIAWAGAERLALGMTDTMDARPARAGCSTTTPPRRRDLPIPARVLDLWKGNRLAASEPALPTSALAGRGRICAIAIRVRGCLRIAEFRMRMQPLTPTLSPQARGEGAQLSVSDAVFQICRGDRRRRMGDGAGRRRRARRARCRALRAQRRARQRSRPRAPIQN